MWHVACGMCSAGCAELRRRTRTGDLLGRQRRDADAGELLLEAVREPVELFVAARNYDARERGRQLVAHERLEALHLALLLRRAQRHRVRRRRRTPQTVVRASPSTCSCCLRARVRRDHLEHVQALAVRHAARRGLEQPEQVALAAALQEAARQSVPTNGSCANATCPISSSVICRESALNSESSRSVRAHRPMGTWTSKCPPDCSPSTEH